MAIFFISFCVIQTLNTATMADLAYLAQKNGWGLLNQFDLPFLGRFLISFLFLDFQSYALHRFYHKVSWAWRFHRVHHSDMDLDVTSGSRLHPFEELVTFGAQQVFVVLLGPSFSAVALYNLFVFISTPFSHANIRLFPWLDRALRWFTITPEMHRIHHSMDWDESNSNFGFLFPWWDYLLGTYRAQPEKPHHRMKLGLAQFRAERYLLLPWLLAFPFLKKRDGSSS